MKNAATIASTLRTHTESISPGLPFRLTAAHTPGDLVWQGDLGIEIVKAKVPENYVLVANPTDADRQLAIEAGVGSHHRLKSFDGVTLYRPVNWGKDDTSLEGPYVVFAKPNAIQHEPGHDRPHGTVFIDAPCSVHIRYQRNLSQEERAIRARD